MTSADQPFVNRLYIIGVGLIGGSLALSLKDSSKPFCKEIIGLGRSTDHLKRGVELGVIDAYETDWSSLVDADVLLISVPLDAYDDVFAKIKPYIDKISAVTDAGSAKACVLKSAQRIFGSIPKQLVPGHPIAGNERSGVEASINGLYKNRRVILTPHEDTDARALSLVQTMWQSAGAEVETMSVEHHDQVLAITSHLPHMLAFGLVDSLAQNTDVNEIFRYAAGGFRDFTRIASSDPVMWRDICLHNRKAILDALINYRNDLEELEAAIFKQDGDALKTIFERAKNARDQFCG